MAASASAPDAAAHSPGVGDSVLICGLTEAAGLSLNGQLGLVTKQANWKGRLKVSVAGSFFRMLPANARRLAFGIGARVEARGVDPESGRALDGHMGTVVGYTFASDRYQVNFAQGGMASLKATSLSDAGPTAMAQVTPQDGPAAQDATGAPAPATEETGEAVASGEPAAPALAAQEPPQATSAEVAAAAALPSKRTRAATDEAPDVVVIEAEPETETKPLAKRGRKAVPSGQAAKPAEKPEVPTQQAAKAGAKPDANAEAEPKVEAKARPLAKKRGWPPKAAASGQGAEPAEKPNEGSTGPAAEALAEREVKHANANSPAQLGQPPKAAASGLAAEPPEKPEEGSAEVEPEAKTPVKRGRPPKVAAAAKQAAGDTAAEQAVKESSPTTPSLKPKGAARSSADVNATPATKRKCVAEEKARSPAAGEAPAARQRRGRLAKGAAGDITSAARGGCGAGGPSGAAAETLEDSDAWKRAVRKGMGGRLLNLASRDSVSKGGFGPDRLLEALLAAGGLVNKAQAALLEAAEA